MRELIVDKGKVQYQFILRYELGVSVCLIEAMDAGSDDE